MKTNKSFQINIPITKIDEEQRIVTGIATTEALDSQGDIVDYEASKKAFSEWKGNIREMHGNTSVGKAIDIQFDDVNKQVTLSSYISESADGQNAWTKIKEGILTGYSIGGRMLEVIKDKSVSGANRIMNYSLSETSLVDNPANPEAEFLMVKSFDGKLNHVETIIDNKLPVSWWMEKFMSKKEIKKGIYDAQEAISVASTLAYLLMSEQMEEVVDQDQINLLTAAFTAVKEFVAKEVVEGDDYVSEYAEVMEMANKAINLKKGTEMKDIEKGGIAVLDGDARDETAATVTPTVTKPVSGGTVVPKKVYAKDGKTTTTINKADDAVEAEVVAEPVEEPVAEVAEEVVEPEVAEEVAPEIAEVAEVAEEAPVETLVEAPAEVVVEEGEKADGIADLAKNVETLLAKLNDSQSGAELKKVTDSFTKLSDKVEKSLTLLEDRMAAIEAQPLPSKAQASYTVVAKSDSEVVPEIDAILKRQDELIANPFDAKPGEAEAIAKAIRNAPKE